MAVTHSFLLIFITLKGIHSITTVSDVSVKAGGSISIPCLYEPRYRNNVKYLCKGYYWNYCSYEVKTNRQSSGTFAISDDKIQKIFTVTMKNMKEEDTGYYWCAVEINNGEDVGKYFHLSVTRGTPSLYVDHQELQGFVGEEITIKCHHPNRGEMKWCRLGSSCVTEPSGSIEGTTVTINRRVHNVFTVAMSGLRTESSGWYWCVQGDLQMPVHLTVTEKPTTGIHSITTVSKVSVKAGGSISIPCLYEQGYRNNVKYLCKGYYWNSCSYAVKTNKQSSGKFSISDDNIQRIFTVSIHDLKEQDTGYYWCAVEINDGEDVGKYFHLSVTRDTPSLYVDQQEITASIGDNITINCHHLYPGVVKWCRLGSSCVTEPSGSIDRTEVTINRRVPNVFTVAMSGLRTESSGWYWCVQGDLQMPVNLTVHEKSTTDQAPTLSPSPAGEVPTAQHEQPSSSSFLTSFTIRLSLLVLFVMVTSFIWFMVEKLNQTTESSATPTEQQEEVRYTSDGAVTFNL